MPQFKNEYRYKPHYGYPKHIWICIGSKGAMHLHISDYGEDENRSYRYSGGLEQHSRTPFSYNDEAPHERCWILGGPCWHDDVSLYCEETLIPFWLMDPHNHERMFTKLENEYKDRFK